MFKKIVIASATVALASTLGLSSPAAAMTAQKTRPIAPPPATDLASTGIAYGTSIRGNTLVTSGPTAASYMCTNDNRRRTGNSVVEVTEESPISVEGVSTWTKRSLVNGNPAATTESRLAVVRLGSNDLVLRNVMARARVVSLGNGEYFRKHTVSIGRLSILGELVELDLPEGPQTLEIPGVGKIRVGIGRNFPVQGGAGTRAMVARIDLNDEDQTAIRIGRASATLVPDRRDVFAGSARALDARVLGLVNVGRIANQPLPCAGTGSVVRENQTAGLTVPGVLSVSGAYGRSLSTQSKNFSLARTEGGIAQVSLGDGQVVIEGLTSVAQVRKARDGRYLFNSGDSRILSLTVDGEAQEIPMDGESMEIPGLGRLDFGVIEERRSGFKRISVLLTSVNELGEVIQIPFGVASAYVY